MLNRYSAADWTVAVLMCYPAVDHIGIDMEFVYAMLVFRGVMYFKTLLISVYLAQFGILFWPTL